MAGRFNPHHEPVALGGSARDTRAAGRRTQQMPMCTYGVACTRPGCIYRHPPKKAEPAPAASQREQPTDLCLQWVAGTCTFGDGCTKLHPKDGTPEAAEAERIRKRYAGTWCRWGDDCRTRGCLYLHSWGVGAFCPPVEQAAADFGGMHLGDGLERRLDQGNAFTLAEFVAYYGGTAEWEAAPPAMPPPGPQQFGGGGGGAWEAAPPEETIGIKEAVEEAAAERASSEPKSKAALKNEKRRLKKMAERAEEAAAREAADEAALLAAASAFESSFDDLLGPAGDGMGGMGGGGGDDGLGFDPAAAAGLGFLDDADPYAPAAAAPPQQERLPGARLQPAVYASQPAAPLRAPGMGGGVRTVPIPQELWLPDVRRTPSRRPPPPPPPSPASPPPPPPPLFLR